MAATYEKEMAGGFGTFAGNKTGTRNAEFVGVYIPNSCTITTLLDKDGKDVTDTYIWDKTAALEGGVYIHAKPEHSPFTQIINSAGAFVLNLDKGQ